jgi:hypothetical protein
MDNPIIEAKQVLPRPLPYDKAGKEYTVWGLITPELAKEYLKRNIANFRKFSEATVDKYIDELINGYWMTNHQGIAFDVNNVLADGQHRLTAIIRTGIPIYMPVTFELPPVSKMTMDQGKKRTTNDALGGEGISLCGSSLSGIIKCAVIGVLGTNRTALTIHESKKYALRLHSGLVFINETFYKGKKIAKITTAPVMGAILRAWYSEETMRDGIKEFCSILLDPAKALESTGDNCAMVINFRESLRNAPKSVDKQSGDSVDATFCKTERVLRAFLDKQNLKAISAAKTELFPFPWERDRDFSEEELTPARPLEVAARLVEQAAGE